LIAGVTNPEAQRPEPIAKESLPGEAPLKDANPPEAETGRTPPEVPKVGSRDAPGG